MRLGGHKNQQDQGWVWINTNILGIIIIMESSKRIEQVGVEIRDLMSRLGKSEKKSEREELITLSKLKAQELKVLIEAIPQFNVQRKRLQGQLKKIYQSIERSQQKNQNYIDVSQSFVRPEGEKRGMTERESKRAILTKMIEIEMDPMNLEMDPEQLEKMADQMEQNLEVMKEINELVQKGGKNLDIITEETIKSLEKIKEAKQEMEQADQAQLKGIMLKVRMGIGSVLALIGAKIFGVAGGIAGFFTGFFSFK